MLLWRISNHATPEGQGGMLASARWHLAGRRIVYFAESAAGAVLEALVHLELPPGNYPAGYKLLKAEAPDDISMRTVTKPELAGDWLNDPVHTRTIGDEWLISRDTALLRVPSAIVPEIFNILLNPEHPQAAQVQVGWHEKYPCDRRLIG